LGKADGRGGYRMAWEGKEGLGFLGFKKVLVVLESSGDFLFEDSHEEGKDF